MKIYFREASGTVLINGQLQTIENYCVELYIPDKWQLLEFKSATYLKIVNVEIEGEKINHHLYIMFDDNKRCTFGDLPIGATQYLPIHPSYAVFKTAVSHYLPNGWYGKQIYDHFEFCIDKPINLSNAVPKPMHDFFAMDTGAHWIKKYDRNSSWFFNESHDLEQIKQTLDPGLFNVDLHTASASDWVMRNIQNPSIDDLKQMDVTWFADMAVKHNFTSISSISCNTLEPGGWIGIHADGNSKHRRKIYLNLDPSDDVYFKFSTTGLIPMNTNKSLWVNTDPHVHAVVSHSTVSRQIISIAGYTDDANWT